MYKNKNRSFTYIEGINDENDFKNLIYKKKKYIISKINRYKNNIHILVGLSGLERAILDLVTEYMYESDNTFFNNVEIRNRMVKFFKDNCNGKMVKASTVQKSIEKFKSKGILIALGNGKGKYFVNPIYFWKSTEEEREKTLRKYTNHFLEEGEGKSKELALKALGIKHN